MHDHILFITGHLALPRLEAVLRGMKAPSFTWEVRNIGVKVAALMTADIIERRLGDPGQATRVMLPGRFKGDLERLRGRFGVPFERGPEDVKDLPWFFGREDRQAIVARPGTRVFAEIVEAPDLSVEGILKRARYLVGEGADVVDLGSLPGTLFPHLEEAVRALKAEGFSVSVDSGDPAELARGAGAGADFLLSLDEKSLDLAFETDAVPVLIPAEHGEIEGLVRSAERLARAGRPFMLDPILDPINMGFTESLLRYRDVRRRCPEAAMLMGVGNLTELTDADTTGITTLLMAACVELAIDNVLVVQVSPHCRRAVREADRSWKMLKAAAADAALPKGYDTAMLCLRDRLPFPSTPAEIKAAAEAVTDRNFRIEAAADGIHIYNRDLHLVGADPFDLYPSLEGTLENDPGHAFYLGAELARAQIAFQLGKRYAQDAQLRWGCAVDLPEEDSIHQKELGATMKRRER